MLRDDVEHVTAYLGANWAFQIKSILERHGLGFIWQSQDIDTVNAFLMTCEYSSELM